MDKVMRGLIAGSALVLITAGGCASTAADVPTPTPTCVVQPTLPPTGTGSVVPGGPRAV